MAEVRGCEVDIEARERAENERQQPGWTVVEQLAETVDTPQRQCPQERLDDPRCASEHTQCEHRRGSWRVLREPASSPCEHKGALKRRQIIWWCGGEASTGE